MMKINRFVRFTAITLITVFGIFGVTTAVPSSGAVANAKSTKVIKVKYSKIAKKAYHLNNGALYTTSKLKKVNHYGVHYKHTTFYSYKKATVKKSNSKLYSYIYIRSSNKKINGWVWKGYLKNGKAPATTKNTGSTSNQTGNSSQTTTTTTTTTTTNGADGNSVTTTNSTNNPQAPITGTVATDNNSTNTTVPTESVTVQVFGPISQGNKTLASGSVPFKDGDTAFTVLQTLSTQQGFKIGFTGSGGSTYVTTINGMTAGTGGVGGGWLYNVNGTYPNYSAGAYKVKSGDVVQWMWTQGMGDRGWTG